MTTLEERIEYTRRLHQQHVAGRLEQDRRAQIERDRQEAAWKRQAAAYGRQLQRVLDDIEEKRAPNRSSGYAIRWFQDEDLMR